MFSFVIATEEGPFEAKMSCSENKCTTCIRVPQYNKFIILGYSADARKVLLKRGSYILMYALV